MSGFISHKYRIIFCHVPRTAGRSLFSVIDKHLGPDDERFGHQPFRYVRDSKRWKKYFNEYLKVAVWRNNEERIESLRNNNPPVGVKETDDYYWSNSQWLGDEKGKLLADILINFNDIERNAKRFLKWLGIECKEFPHLNKKPPPSGK